MKNNEYNSLTEKLIQSGILQTENEPEKSVNDVNFFNVKNFDEDTDEVSQVSVEQPIKKRINNYDLELLEKADGKPNTEYENNLQKILYKFFPKLYEFKIAKDSIQKISELGIDVNSLLDKTVPYGEGEIRYKNLVKFIKYANEVQTKLKRKQNAKNIK